MNKWLLATIARMFVFVCIGAGFVALMYWFELRADKSTQDFTMFYFFIVPFVAGLTAIMCLLQLHYYRHPEQEN